MASAAGLSGVGSVIELLQSAADDFAVKDAIAAQCSAVQSAKCGQYLLLQTRGLGAAGGAKSIRRHLPKRNPKRTGDTLHLLTARLQLLVGAPLSSLLRNVLISFGRAVLPVSSFFAPVLHQLRRRGERSAGVGDLVGDHQCGVSH
jgi:hypothetical protein